MNALCEQIFAELRHLLGETHNGGAVGPSVYDTARVLWFHHAPADLPNAYAWLIAQQQADGGWGSADFPLFRHAPTWAAWLALQRASACIPGAAAALEAATAFLERQPDPYARAVPDDAPIGAELILPALSGEAAALSNGAAFPRHPALWPLRQARLAKLAKGTSLPSGHPLLHSWEAWGPAPASACPDEDGSIGISPAATAAWRAQALQQGDTLQAGRAAAYLQAAARATRSGIEGIVPNVWPINVFEPAWSLYTLHLAGLFAHPALAEAVRATVAPLAARMSARGLGPALHFAADADDTAVVLSVLHLAGRAPTADALRQFERGALFVTFPGERNASVSTNIHALHALRLLGEPAVATRTYVETNRNPEGVWGNEKWHVSWLYPTAHAIAALAQGHPRWRDECALAALLQAQHADGGWGAGSAPTFEETAYALFALHAMDSGETPEARRLIAQAVAQARAWMLARYVPHALPQTALWIGKELYCPLLVVRVTELAGLWLALQWEQRAADGVTHTGAAP
ncbi:hypothetical protein ACQR5T_07475 [Xanthomonas oryzae pv. oryzicola]|uniref:hypothetical protein n=1 Tax=Xanthomonas oryzae TaxID=347 RepID=UPI0004077AFD|nr:hypothetical protein [Xanthomonas oryzae]AKO06308.1 hypothetical protein ACU16_21750 [Xanthomonas oryzae pv. oryzicola]AKO10223.1 hypothetical protein ACU17_21770 [Xanthomonas oryzae pv. oryzicola]OWB22603.1 hypothetical protein XocBAI15_15555 [Xanthomonas oryzae pv. oryzicola]OWB32950.1 hypothetical protein XocBAI20_01910 [Xanthomonas oryzae pv. oryzicola]